MLDYRSAGGYPPKFDRFLPGVPDIVTECINPSATCHSGYNDGTIIEVNLGDFPQVKLLEAL